MNYLDIILFAVIAAFVLARLWFVLGRKNDDENERPNPFTTPPPSVDDEEDVMVLPKQLPGQESIALTPAGHAAASLAGVIDQIRAKDPAFDEKQFLQGAKTAFTLIVEAFIKGDLSPAVRWLEPSVLESFQNAIAVRQAAGEKLEGRIERVAEAEITTAKLDGARAFLTVGFTSYQENILRDAAGQIISGTPGQAEEINDVWVFSRDLNSEDPNWLLAETHS